jgi:hypothetical protein
MLDKDALRRFAPKEIFKHYRAFDQALESIARRHSWYRGLVSNPLGIFRGAKYIPVIHLIALYRNGQWNYFPGRAQPFKPEHRMVGESGATEELAMQPLLQLEVVTDPQLTVGHDVQVARQLLLEQAQGGMATLQALTREGNMASTPAQLFSIPLAMILTPTSKRYLRHRFTLYQHIFGAGHEYPTDGLFYVGITSRDWQKRWGEHRAAINRGSSLKFHRAYRERKQAQQLTYVHHKVMGVASTLDELHQLEEVFVAGHWDDTRLLNMIPGGKAGIEYLHKHRVFEKKVVSMPEELERTLENWLREHPRKGLPAPWVAEQWKDPEYAMKVICGPEGRLSVEQVMLIRTLGQGGTSADEIVDRVGARSAEQVKGVLTGRTYGRVPAEAAGSSE